MTNLMQPSTYVQVLIIAVLFIGYYLLFWARKALIFVIPFVLTAGDMSQSELGLLLSWQQAGYTVSKFIAGLLVDRVSPKALLTGAFGLSGVLGLALAATESLLLRCILMIASGIVIGVAWPSTVKIAKAWVAPFAFGTAWAVLSTAMNACGIVGAPLSVRLSIDYSWRASVRLPSICCLAFCLPFVLLISSEPSGLKARPGACESACDKSGFTARISRDEKTRTGDASCTLSDDKTRTADTSCTSSDDNRHTGDASCTSKHNQSSKTTWLSDWWQLLADPICLSVNLGYMSVNACRYAVDWLPVFLAQSCGLTPTDGAKFTSSLQAGGVFGSLAAGMLADAAFAFVSSSKKLAWLQQPRLLLLCGYNLLCVVFYHTIVSLSSPSWPVWLYQTLGFCLGVCLFGPVAVYGVIATECAPNRLAFTSHAFCALFANIGAMASGYPLGWAAEKFGWPVTVTALELWVLATTAGHFLVLSRSSLSAKEQRIKID